MMLPEEQVEAMLAGPLDHRPPELHPLRTLVAGLVDRDLAQIEILASGVRVRAWRHPA